MPAAAYAHAMLYFRGSMPVIADADDVPNVALISAMSFHAIAAAMLMPFSPAIR